GKVYCLDYQLNKQWDFNTGSPVRSTAGIADVNRDGNFEIIIGSDNGNLYCLDKDGNKIDSYNLGSVISCSPAIANIDSSDEELEFIIGYRTVTTSSSSKVACFKLELDAQLKWKINNKWTYTYDYTQNFELQLNVIAVDLDAYPDGGFEVIMADGHNVFVINTLGQLIDRYSSHYHSGSPVIADIDSDGDLEITVGYEFTNIDTKTEHLMITQTDIKCPPDIIKWGMFGAGEKHNCNGDNRYAILIEGGKGDNAFEQQQFRSDIQEMARILTVHPNNTGPGYTGHYLLDHIFYVGVHDDIPELNIFSKIPENNDLKNPSSNDPDDDTGKTMIFEAIE
ncbi:MAG: PQQ-like beta-propeller repeat protein, partial [Thermoplasmata archaeon]|nr:PQQ-like beta-propeller repeat protein [Thermoplasmata archaeon]